MSNIRNGFCDSCDDYFGDWGEKPRVVERNNKLEARRLYVTYSLNAIIWRVKNSYNKKKKRYPEHILKILNWISNFLLADICKLEQENRSIEEEIEFLENLENYRTKYFDRQDYEFSIMRNERKIETLNRKFRAIGRLLDKVNANKEFDVEEI